MPIVQDYISGLTECLDEISGQDIEAIADIIVEAWEKGKQVFLVGNGGSASTASHLARDLSMGTMGKGKSGNAFTASWLTQVSNEPPMVIVSIKNSHQSAKLLNELDAFAVNILPQGEEAIAKTYYGPAESGYAKLESTTLNRGAPN